MPAINRSSYQGIIGKIFYAFRKDLWKNQCEFYQSLGMSENTAISYISNNTAKKNMNFDYYNKKIEYIKIGDLEKNIEKNIGPFVSCDSQDTSILSKYNRILIDIISEKNLVYSEVTTPTEQDKIKYNQEDLERLLIYLRIYNSVDDFTHNLYLVLYLALNKSIPKEVFYGAVYEQNLHEFNEKVTKLYGINSDQAMRAIFRLADSKNLIALYEKADMFYFGKNSIPKDIAKAYELYKETAGLDRFSNMPDKKRASDIHPLSLWSLSFILFNYHRKGTSLENCDSIPEIDYWLGLGNKDEGRIYVIERALLYANFSLNLINNAPSANILGKISMLTNDDVPGMEDLKTKYNLKDPEEYFKCAADNGYVYSMNNVAVSHSKKIFTDKPENIKMHLEQYLKYLGKSAEQCETWACNELGNFYRTGIVHNWNNNFTRDSNSFMEFKNYVSMDKALKHYKNALAIEFDKHSGKACYNILCCFPEYVKKENKLKEYVTKISNLNIDTLTKDTKKLLPKLYNVEFEDILNKGE